MRTSCGPVEASSAALSSVLVWYGSKVLSGGDGDDEGDGWECECEWA